MSDLFDRNCLLKVVRRPTSVKVGNFFKTEGEELTIQGGDGPGKMHLSFSVTRNLGKDPNKCDITATNLSPQTLTLLDKQPLQVSLLGGYAGEQRLIFVGDLRHSFTEQDGATVKTKISVGDGLRAFKHARMAKSYRPPIRVQSVLSDAAKSLGLSLPEEVLQSVELKEALSSGINTHGPTRDVLTRLLAPYGMSWSVQNGALTILADGQVRAGEAYEISERTGLLGSPQRAVQDKPKGKIPVTFKVRLFPELSPGREVNIIAQRISGRFRLQEVTHDGDSGSGDFISSCKAVPL